MQFIKRYVFNIQLRLCLIICIYDEVFFNGANSSGRVENASFHIGPPQTAYFYLHGRAEYKTHCTIKYKRK
jgi:hypothetical protein